MGSALYLDINNFSRRTPWLHTPMADYATYYGLGLFAILMLIAWWYARRQPVRVMASALLAPVLAVLAFVINQPIARTIGERRPFDKFPEALVLVAKHHDWSFPSDHLMISGAVTLTLFYVSKRLGFISLFVALLLAFARVYVGAHYPQDVLAGLVLGGAISAVLRYVLMTPVAWFVRWGRTSRFSGVLIATD